MSFDLDATAGPQVLRATAIVHNEDQHSEYAMSLMQRDLAHHLASAVMVAKTVRDEAGYGKRHEVELLMFTREQLTWFIQRQVERHRHGAPYCIIY